MLQVALLRALRDRRRLSQKALADAVGVSQRQIGRYEKGVQQPTLDVARRLADVFDVTIDELAGRVPSMPTAVDHRMRRAADAELDATLERLDQELRAVRGLLGLAPPGAEDPPLEQSG